VNPNLIALIVAIPLATGILCAFTRRSKPLCRTIGLAALLANLGLVLTLLSGINTEHPMLVSMMGQWAPPYGIAIVFDGLSGTLLAVTLTVAIAAYIHSWNILPRNIERGWFHPLYHLLILGVNFSFLTGDLFNLFVAFEIMLMASYALMCLGGTRQQMSQAFKYVMLNLVGSTVFVLTAGMIYGVTGTLNYADLARFVAENEGALPTGFQALSVALLFVFCLKAAVFPLWFWLPDTYHTLPSSIGAVFAALLSKVGVYAILRMYPMAFASPTVDDLALVRTILALLAGFTMVVAILGAIGATNLRRIIAMILIAHVGYLIFGITLMNGESFAATLHYMAQEMIIIAGLMLTVGIIERRAGSVDIRELGGLARRFPLLSTGFFLLAMGLVGIPPLSGFYGKAVLLREGASAGSWMLVGATTFAAVFTLVAIARVWITAFWSDLKGPLLKLPDGAKAGPDTALPFAYAGVAMLLAVSLALGLGAERSYSWTQTATASIANPSIYIDGVLNLNPTINDPAPGALAAAGTPSLPTPAHTTVTP
jgi:multicomponent Na+:H+ antiporter subunit D